LTPSFEGNPFTQEHEILSRKIRDLEAARGEDFVILACTVLIQQLTSVTDGQTDAQAHLPSRNDLKFRKNRKFFGFHATSETFPITRKPANYTNWFTSV